MCGWLKSDSNTVHLIRRFA